MQKLSSPKYHYVLSYFNSIDNIFLKLSRITEKVKKGHYICYLFSCCAYNNLLEKRHVHCVTASSTQTNVLGPLIIT